VPLSAFSAIFRAACRQFGAKMRPRDCFLREISKLANASFRASTLSIDVSTA